MTVELRRLASSPWPSVLSGSPVSHAELGLADTQMHTNIPPHATCRAVLPMDIEAALDAAHAAAI